jgi:hypothetical protein
MASKKQDKPKKWCLSLTSLEPFFKDNNPRQVILKPAFEGIPTPFPARGGVGELVATRVTPIARQFTGWSFYAAVFTLISIPFLLIASPFFWRSHRRLAISSLCVAVGAILISTFHTW